MIGKILDILFPSRVREREKQQQFDDMLEEVMFNSFMMWKKKREDEKHPNAQMAKGVSKCAVGRYWVEKDYIDLIGAIAPGVTLEDFSRATGRSYTGCINRLRMLSIVVRSKNYGYRDVIRPVIPVSRLKIHTANGKRLDLTDEMCRIGYIREGKVLKAPEWLTKQFEIR
ncbi:protein of unknown function [Pseudotevenvirus RB43]|uniref:Uncharacterized protein n=2 Tax=Pseudotevenvirus RB43 TaxID=115991 RepID=Q56BD4_9CAUD|nr:hypothetical protein RB43ORF265w [Escherichia phage RB43]AAX78787.1 hypothetical protein RB43ORF265w [Escherichia phage RB43]CCK74107.1 protein of unknown function [Pseudotevenvirus RB43]CCL97724.1 protein of unknown function [Pseudotevenvirus RB43]